MKIKLLSLLAFLLMSLYARGMNKEKALEQQSPECTVDGSPDNSKSKEERKNVDILFDMILHEKKLPEIEAFLNQFPSSQQKALLQRRPSKHTALSLALQEPSKLEIAEFFIQKGANPRKGTQLTVGKNGPVVVCYLAGGKLISFEEKALSQFPDLLKARKSLIYLSDGLKRKYPDCIIGTYGTD